MFAMTTGISAKACKDGVTRAVETFRVSTPIGVMHVKICQFGLHMLYQSPEITDETFLPDPNVEIAVLSAVPKIAKQREHLEKCIKWLETYFTNVKLADHQPFPALCTVSENGSFQERVLLTLAKNVHVGQTISYAELANLTGSPRAQQSVGSAMAKNPFQLIVPCHRVIKSGQKVGAYARGRKNSVKVWLLRHEGLVINEDKIST